MRVKIFQVFWPLLLPPAPTQRPISNIMPVLVPTCLLNTAECAAQEPGMRP